MDVHQRERELSEGWREPVLACYWNVVSDGDRGRDRSALQIGQHDSLGGPHADSDNLAIPCPSTAETRKSINAETIAKLPDGAIVVNTARGNVVDDEALIAALKSGKLFAAGMETELRARRHAVVSFLFGTAEAERAQTY